MKRLAALFIALTLIFTFLGCSTEPKEKDAVDEYFEKKQEATTEFIAYGKEEEEISKDPLRIMMDLEYVGRDVIDVSVILNEFLSTLEQSSGLSDVVVEYVPGHGADRESMLDRVRVELMSGGGPDVFIVNCGGMSLYAMQDSKPLFPFPEKAMDSGLFLPLDEYMENNTQFAEWDKQTQTVLSAGRNDEGQQIIPLTYTLPLICYSTNDVPEFPAAENASWTDIINDPVLSDLARPLYGCIQMQPFEGEYIPNIMNGRAEYILGGLADYSSGKLLFTEEEALQRVNDLCTLYDRTKEIAPDGKETYPYSITCFGMPLAENMSLLAKEPVLEDGPVECFYGTEPLTLAPLYSDDGGVTASIMSFAAINRNSQCPEEAFTVIDLLMRDFVQRKYSIYSELLTGVGVGITMHEDLMLKDTPVGGRNQWYMSEHRFGEVCEIRDRITVANFRTELDVLVYDMFTDCLVSYINGGSEEEIQTLISGYYEKMQRLVRE